ncbi:hypothetical protein ABZ707_18375 [Streptomyces sp. NPDC006923]|uniref:hypothetical protein n=1 Tax=Streptomyces sp. NPDC006923 TaxID=3155355 RepID=UPI00340DCAD4
MAIEFIGIAAAKAAGRTAPPGISVSFRPILGATEELARERAHRAATSVAGQALTTTGSAR